MKVSVIIPVRNEAGRIQAMLGPLQSQRGGSCELIVVDGGSHDATARLAEPLADRVIDAVPGRARQMNAGAAVATGELFWFLHADSAVRPEALEMVRAAARRRGWGRFDVRLDGRQPLLRVVEWSMNTRSRLTGVATGDQGIFVRRDWFEAVGGYPDIDLMEDIAISVALKRLGPPACLDGPLVTSSRRWERHGILRTILQMWWLRLAYKLGADPGRLGQRYHRA